MRLCRDLSSICFPEWFQFSKDTERLLKTVQGQVIWPQWCTFSVVVLIIYALPGRVDLLHKLLPVLSLQWAPVWLSGCLTVRLWYSLSTVDLADGLLRLLLLRIYLCIHLFATPTAWPWYFFFFCMVSCECVGGVMLALLWALCLWLHPWIAVQQRLDYFFSIFIPVKRLDSDLPCGELSKQA